MSLIFLSTYAAAQFVAGSKALHVLFGWEEFVGALIGAAIVASYSWAGGIRASIWTDALQAVVMMVAMIVLLVIALDFVGGISAAWTTLDAVSPTHMDLDSPGSAIRCTGAVAVRPGLDRCGVLRCGAAAHHGAFHDTGPPGKH